MLYPSVLVYCFGGFLVWVVSLLAGDRPISHNSESLPSSPVANYRLISNRLSTVFERRVSVCFGRFMERSGVLPTIQFAVREGLGTCDARLLLSHTLQSALESGQEGKIVQIDFIAAFDRVNHQGILYKLCSVCIGGSVFSILNSFYETLLSTL